MRGTGCVARRGGFPDDVRGCVECTELTPPPLTPPPVGGGESSDLTPLPFRSVGEGTGEGEVQGAGFGAISTPRQAFEVPIASTPEALA